MKSNKNLKKNSKKNKKDIFTLLSKKKVTEKPNTKKYAKEQKTTREKIMYILATMKFKKNTIMFVRNLSKRLQDGKTISKDQLSTLNQIYDEWIAGKPKIVKREQPKRKIRVINVG